MVLLLVLVALLAIWAVVLLGACRAAALADQDVHALAERRTAAHWAELER